jgi:hypothetical protein
VPDQQLMVLNPIAPVAPLSTPSTSAATYVAPSTGREPATANGDPAPVQPAQPAITAQPSQGVSVQQAPSVQVQVADSPLQLQLSPQASVSKEQLQDSLAAFIGALESRVAQLDVDITTLSDELLAGNTYAYLNARVPEDSQLAEAIREQYPALFETTQLTQEGMQQAAESTLSEVGLGLTHGLLELSELPDMAAEIDDGVLNESLSQLHDEIKGLRAQLEAEQARERQLAQARDLAWETLTALKNKVAELSLARAAASSEVRLAAPAVVPVEPVPGLGLLVAVALAGMVGLLAAVFMALMADYLGKRPFLSRGT